MYNKFFISIIAGGLFIIAACKKDAAEKKGVFISTSNVTDITPVTNNNVTTMTAVGSGELDIVGSKSISERGICWAITSQPTIENNKAIANGSDTGHFTASMEGLTPGSLLYARAYVINNGQPFYGNEVQFEASVVVQLITNGDFETEDQSAALVNAAGWRTDESDPGILGRSTDDRNTTKWIWVYSTSKSFYQTIGTVPSSKSDYAIGFDGNYDWTDWGNGYDATIGVIFSAYTGDDPTARVVIDTVKISTGGFPGWGNNWGRKTGTFAIPEGSPYAGMNLVVEFDMLPYIDPANGDIWDDTVWYNFDNVTVSQTIK